MKNKNLVTLCMALLGHVVATAQHDNTERSLDAFYVDTKANTFAFYLPRATRAGDKITITNEQGIVVRSEEVNNKLLKEQKYTMPTHALAAESYTVAVSSGDRLVHSFIFNNRENAEMVPEQKPEAGSTSFGVNPENGEFSISTHKKIAAGTLLEIYSSNNTLVASAEVTAQMVDAHRYSVKAGALAHGEYVVKVDGRNFGNVRFQ
jgi:hypothetical protein